jgi:hypothetical protein
MLLCMLLLLLLLLLLRQGSPYVRHSRFIGRHLFSHIRLQTDWHGD